MIELTNILQLGCDGMVLLSSIPQKFFGLFHSHGLPIQLNKGSFVFREGERAENIFFVESGAVQIGKESESGKELTIRICGPNSVFGESALFCNMNVHTATAKALRPSKLLALNVDALELLLSENPNLLLEYVQWVQIENTKNQTRLRDLVMHGKKGALYSTLIRLANTYGSPLANGDIFIDMNLTNTDIANLCGTSREMINRMLNDLKKQHIISFERGEIVIHEIQTLKKEIDCDNCPLTICRID